MNVARTVIVAIVLLLLQIALVPHLAIAGAAPDLLVILLVALTLGRNPVAAVIIGALLGFLADLGNASFLGANVVAKSIVAYGVSRLGVLLPEHALYRAFVVLAACLANDLVILAVTTSFDAGALFSGFFRYSLLAALYSAAVGFCIDIVLELFGRRVVRSGGSG